MSTIGQKLYERRTEAEWLNVKVRNVVPIRNGWGTIPAGTVFSITRKYQGFSLQADPCPCCGLSASISGVTPDKVEIHE